MDQRPKSYRCSNCDTNWPLAPSYERCPECGGSCWACSDDGVTLLEAKNRIIAAANERREREADERRRTELHRKFDEYYAAREIEKLHAELDNW